MGSSKIKTVDMSISADAKSNTDAPNITIEKEEKAATRNRSKRYKAVRGMVDKTKLYSLEHAVETLKRISYSKFVGTITADAEVREDKLQLETTFPHSTGKSVRVVIADENVLADIEQGTTDFDILLATPAMMPKIAKHARVLGPKGLMPNPKSGTVTDNPEARKKELEAGSVTIKTERKFPLIHVTVGKTDMKDSQIIENVAHLIRTVGPRKIKKLSISASMSPGVKVDLSEFITVK